MFGQSPNRDSSVRRTRMCGGRYRPGSFTVVRNP